MNLPCPHCTLVGFKSYYWHLLSGALGAHLLSSAVSGIAAPQSEALCNVLKVCGMMRLKVTDPSRQAMKQRFVVETLVMCEARLPLSTCTIVRHIMLHFYEVGGWVDELAIGPSVSK